MLCMIFKAFIVIFGNFLKCGHKIPNTILFNVYHIWSNNSLEYYVKCEIEGGLLLLLVIPAGAYLGIPTTLHVGW